LGSSPRVEVKCFLGSNKYDIASLKWKEVNNIFSYLKSNFQYAFPSKLLDEIKLLLILIKCYKLN
jgi:hypothetical protein